MFFSGYFGIQADKSPSLYVKNSQCSIIKLYAKYAYNFPELRHTVWHSRACMRFKILRFGVLHHYWLLFRFLSSGLFVLQIFSPLYLPLNRVFFVCPVVLLQTLLALLSYFLVKKNTSWSARRVCYGRVNGLVSQSVSERCINLVHRAHVPFGQHQETEL